MIFPRTGEYGSRVISVPSGELGKLFVPEFIEGVVNSGLDEPLKRALTEAVSLTKSRVQA